MTDSGGRYVYEIIGDPKNMRHLFLVTIEKSGFRTKEAHFVLPEADECIEDEETNGNITSNETVEDLGSPQQNESIEEETEYERQINGEKGDENAENKTSEQNQTAKNETSEGKREEQGAASTLCSYAFLLAILSLFIVRKRSSRI